MGTRNQIITAIRDTDRRLTRLTSSILSTPECPLRQGSWTVRDALCHVAARANGVSLARTYADPQPESTAAPPVFEIDAINRRQIAERQGSSVPNLLEEIAEGHRAALAQLAQLDDAQLARPLQLPFLEPSATVADLILRAGPDHERAHLESIAEALDHSDRA